MHTRAKPSPPPCCCGRVKFYFAINIIRLLHTTHSRAYHQFRCSESAQDEHPALAGNIREAGGRDVLPVLYVSLQPFNDPAIFMMPGLFCPERCLYRWICRFSCPSFIAIQTVFFCGAGPAEGRLYCPLLLSISVFLYFGYG